MLYNICMMQVLDIYSFEPCSFFASPLTDVLTKSQLSFHSICTGTWAHLLYLTIKKLGWQVFSSSKTAFKVGFQSIRTQILGRYSDLGRRRQRKRQIAQLFSRKKVNSATIPFCFVVATKPAFSTEKTMNFLLRFRNFQLRHVPKTSFNREHCH